MRRGARIGVLHKAAALLDLLASEGEMTAAELADRVGEPRTTVYRILTSLSELDLVGPGPRGGGFVLGIQLWQLGAASVALLEERWAASPAMRQLHEVCGETVFLCVRRGNRAVCVERIDGERVQSLALRLGGSLPLDCGAAPRTLLAYEASDFISAYLGGRANGLGRELRSIRRRGYAISDEDVTPGIAAIGVPFFDYTGRICGAISISGTKPMILGDRRQALVRRLLITGRRASTAMAAIASASAERAP